MKNVNLGSKVVSLLIALTLVLHWKNIVVPLQVAFGLSRITGWTIGLVAIATLFLLTNLIAAVGMYQSRTWGFTAAYVAIISTTLLFATSYIPFVTKLSFLPWPGASVIFLNALVLIYVFYINRLGRGRG